ncbi:hypothetical protein quinque_000364 [Culex quinquefasciatus]
MSDRQLALMAEEKKPLAARIFMRPGVIEEEPDSLDSVIGNLPLTIVPSLARISTHGSGFSRQESVRDHSQKPTSPECFPRARKLIAGKQPGSYYVAFSSWTVCSNIPRRWHEFDHSSAVYLRSSGYMRRWSGSNLEEQTSTDSVVQCSSNETMPTSTWVN